MSASAAIIASLFVATPAGAPFVDRPLSPAELATVSASAPVASGLVVTATKAGLSLSVTNPTSLPSINNATFNADPRSAVHAATSLELQLTLRGL